MKTAMDWVHECKYISDVTDKNGKVKEMNNSKAVFLRYCKMQKAVAEKQGFHDSATYIQQCIDDLEAPLRNPAKRKSVKKPRTAAQKAATRRMLAANANRPKHVRTAAQKKARKAANNVPGYYPNPATKKHSSLYWVFTVHDGYVSFRTDSGYTGSTPFAAIPELNKSKNPGYAYAKWVGLKRGQFEVLDDRAMKRNPATKKSIDPAYRKHQGKYLVFAFNVTKSKFYKKFIAAFDDRAKAFEYARAYNKAHGVRVTVET